MSNKKVSLEGVAVYPWLNTPDHGRDEFKDPDGHYHVKLRLDTTNPAVAEWVEWIDSEHEKAVAQFVEEQVGDDKKYKTEKALLAAVRKARNIADLNGRKPYTFIDDDEGEPTDEILVNFKMKAKVTNRKTKKSFTLKPRIFDAKGKLMKNPPFIYSGSTLKVSYTPKYWGTVGLGASVRFQLEAVQVINLVTGGGSDDADDYGFGEEEGFEANESALNEAPPAQVDTDDDVDDDVEDDGTGDF